MRSAVWTVRSVDEVFFASDTIIGIKKEKEVDTISYVFSKFSKKEMDSIVGIMSNMPNIIDNLLNNGVEYIMNHYNGVKNEIF